MTAFLTQRRAFALVVAVLLISSIARNSVSFAIASVPAALVQGLAAPFAWPLGAIATALRGDGERGVDSGVEASVAGQRLAEAAVYITQLEQRLYAAEQQLAQLMQTQQVSSGARYVVARVSGSSGDPTQPTITIDKGASRGIGLDSTVVSGVSLVGRVIDASPASARVSLISAKDTRLFVWIKPPDVLGGPREVLEQVTRSTAGAMFEARIEQGKTVRIGDIAYLADELWPPEAQGFIVGRVTRVEPAPDNPLQFQRVLIDPIPELSQLRRATVLVPVE